MARVDTAQLAEGADGLLGVAHALLDVRTSMTAASGSCADASGALLGGSLDGFRVAVAAYADLVGEHLLAAGWLAENLALDLDAATGGPSATGAD